MVPTAFILVHVLEAVGVVGNVIGVIDVIEKHYKLSYLYIITTRIQHKRNNRYTNRTRFKLSDIIVADSVLGVKRTRTKH